MAAYSTSSPGTDRLSCVRARVPQAQIPLTEADMQSVESCMSFIGKALDVVPPTEKQVSY